MTSIKTVVELVETSHKNNTFRHVDRSVSIVETSPKGKEIRIHEMSPVQPDLQSGW